MKSGAQSIIDQELEVGSDRTKEEFSRLRVGTSVKELEHCLWALEYDPFSDNGFRLYNPIHKCYLASIFRTFPDYDNGGSNDTIIAQLNLELEAACTFEANNIASRMYVIEGMTSLQNTNRQWGLLFDSFRSYITPIIRFYFRGYSILQATYNLAQFRALYSRLQDTPLLLLKPI
ncbi:hypothetical protein MGYG_05006 [Nannizzia gypsea CBS 118893]|uniref:Uncharacterized protein n=1 Tax=Arthroderma gypseum (strain ATCC MYA-4604 / CBS 118893) TaxID=535722 RepID=E4UY10_ARTGP|nr:hypothetical protein MGYG_05006 [Nannizzia gypsea CBS 118893]EFR02003.1 hypothetical protein MGYG_05006 [Nannizzia gypsea CBS 118893]